MILVCTCIPEHACTWWFQLAWIFFSVHHPYRAGTYLQLPKCESCCWFPLLQAQGVLQGSGAIPEIALCSWPSRPSKNLPIALSITAYSSVSSVHTSMYVYILYSIISYHTMVHGCTRFLVHTSTWYCMPYCIWYSILYSIRCASAVLQGEARHGMKTF